MNWVTLTDDDSFDMPGTEGTNTYKPVVKTDRAQVGLRCVREGQYRIRVEPSGDAAAESIGKVLLAADGWTQPGDGGQPRFSKVVFGSADEALAKAVEAVKDGATFVRLQSVTVVPAETESAKRERLIARVRQLGVPGSNFASRWKTATLEAAVTKAEPAS